MSRVDSTDEDLEMRVKIKDIEVKHKERQQRVKELKSRVVSQIKELDFKNLEHTQKIKIVMAVGSTF